MPVLVVRFNPSYQNVASIDEVGHEAKGNQIIQFSQDTHGLPGLGHSYHLEPILLERLFGFARLEAGQEPSHVGIHGPIVGQVVFAESSNLVSKRIPTGQDTASS